ncbi:hypothetical protein DCAR_0102049 [Daucus carota subsp. sativus]|uniref:Uncharacterized protein n=1 Tax=Daucus carota subsp. sativus TaxID=79200 RepID=A0A166GU75_DAUCS|nr:hypothetical protein DCAR_0102049 [Daucus carota subsp. sativus]
MCQEEKQRAEAAETSLAAKNKELEDSYAKLVKAESARDAAVDNYLEGEEYEELIRAHDDMFYPKPFVDGWRAALRSIEEKFPGALDLSEFQVPENIIRGGSTSATSVFVGGDNRIIVPVHSPLQDRTEENPDEVTQKLEDVEGERVERSPHHSSSLHD